MASRLSLLEEEMVADKALGYPLAYAKLCRNVTHFNLYSSGPPLDFMPRALSSQEIGKAKDLNMLFPVVDPEGTPSVDPHGFANLLWKQLAHLGNAGFDPVLFRVDQYGNVLYFHADPASPLHWRIDHWFPISRGGKTVPSNLRILQWQVFRKKHDKLEFLIPWWDLQLGISVNQFLSMFASRNSDFRNRAFSFLFKEGGNEKLNEEKVVDSHTFPHHFDGIAPDAIVMYQRHQLRSLKMKRRPSLGEDDHEDFTRSIQRFKRRISKENDDPNIESSQSNAYFSIELARNSLKEREEGKKIQAEMIELENELDVLNHRNDSERIALQDLEVRLIKKRRRVEKCRRLAQSQSSYKALLEKMIRDAMHQTVVYKEQVRLNQAANSALMARLEAQRAICDSSEKELYNKYKQGDEIKKQIDEPPPSELGRKRSRMSEIVDENCDEKMNAVLYVKQDDEIDAVLDLKQKDRRDTMFDERRELIARSILASRISSVKPAIKKELRQFLEEEHKASEVGTSVGDEEEIAEELPNTYTHSKNEEFVDDKLKKPPSPVFGSCSKIGLRKTVSVPSSPNFERDEELQAKLGKKNMEQWVKILLKNAKDDTSLSESPPSRSRNANQITEDIVHKLNVANPQKEIKLLKLKPSEEKERPSFKCHELQTRESSSNLFESGGTFKGDMGETTDAKNIKERLKKKCSSKEASTSSACDIGSVKYVEWNEMEWKRGRNFRSFPSPLVKLGIKRGMDCVKRPHAAIGEMINHNTHI